ncbi:MAG: hypothetical protein O8C64_11495 [Candidatus Methanoperedens sp.]|nr:hypothetical protein [Candidatus Methanoperedens sp.]MCZ7405698.1 hypothetical protein [Candidatus Methanoperedens sp.]
MKQQLEQRLKELRAEFDSGQRTLGEMEIKQANLRNTLLRISGAIQVLEEELARENQPGLNNIETFGEIPQIEPAAE